MSVANLIQAVQTCNASNVEQVIQTIRNTTKNRLETYRTINQGLPQNGITALHVACKMYALKPWLRGSMDEVIEVLIKAGASPYALAYVTPSRHEEDSISPLMCCEGLFPNAIRAFLDENVSDRHNNSAQSIPYGWAIHGLNTNGLGEASQTLNWYKKRVSKTKAKQPRAHA